MLHIRRSLDQCLIVCTHMWQAHTSVVLEIPELNFKIECGKRSRGAWELKDVSIVIIKMQQRDQVLDIFRQTPWAHKLENK